MGRSRTFAGTTAHAGPGFGYVDIFNSTGQLRDPRHLVACTRTGHVGQALWGGIVWGTSRDNPYFKNTDPGNALAFPVRSPSIIAKFPPSLLIAATRDPALSSVVHTHSVLINQGVDAELHVWEGLGHAFFMDPDLPQSREVHAVTVKFFDTRLGR